MAEQNRKNAGAKGKQPISRHPLFPATVALWFGALFGLGSLAVRPGLLEQAVLALHLDTVLTAAAPPLGTSARMAFAGFLALVGAVIGVMLARRLARPRQEVTHRDRDISGFGRGKGSVHSQSTTKVTGQRRRALAIEEPPPPDFHEYAPLPGGAHQILNVTDVDFGQFETGDAPLAQTGSGQEEVDMLDLSRFELEGSRPLSEPERMDLATSIDFAAAQAAQPLPQAYEPEPAQFAQRPFDAAPAESPASAGFGMREYAPFAEAPSQQSLAQQSLAQQPLAQQTFAQPNYAAPTPQPELTERQVFVPVAEASFAPQPEPGPGLRSFDAPAMTAASTPPAMPREYAPAPAFLPNEPVVQNDAAFNPAPSFQQLAPESASASASAPAPAPAPAPMQRFGQDDAAMPAAVPFGFPANTAPSLFDTSGGVSQSAAQVVAQASARLDIQSQALSSDQAKATGVAPTFQAIAEDTSYGGEEDFAPAIPPEFSPVSFSAPTPQPAAPVAQQQPIDVELSEMSQLQLIERLAVSLQRRRALETGTMAAAMAVSAPAPAAAPAAPIAVSFAQPVQTIPEAAPAPETVPAAAPAFAPIPQDFAPPPLAEPAMVPIPSALRPIDFAVDADDGLPAFVPPRHIAMPVTAAPQAPVPFAMPHAFEPEAVAPAMAAQGGDDEVEEASHSLEDGYSSLLNLSRPVLVRQPFVRIEEPVDAGAPIEPAVVFPGQGGSGTVATAAFGVPPGLEPISAAPVAQQDDREETDRALRAALATLQRMSGAA